MTRLQRTYRPKTRFRSPFPSTTLPRGRRKLHPATTPADSRPGLPPEPSREWLLSLRHSHAVVAAIVVIRLPITQRRWRQANILLRISRSSKLARFGISEMTGVAPRHFQESRYSDRIKLPPVCIRRIVNSTGESPAERRATNQSFRDKPAACCVVESGRGHRDNC